MQASSPSPLPIEPLTLEQSSFSAALLQAELPIPDDVVGPTKNKQAVKRFGVYRNNVIVSLTEALMAAFPTIVQLVGEEYFRAMARVYVATSPPKTAMMSTYGATFGAFLDEFEPVRSVPYLGDIARLEQAWRRAYNAADMRPLDASELQKVAPENLGALTFEMHPAVELLSCGHAAYSIWAAHRADDIQAAMAEVEDTPEDILITRPKWDVSVISLPAGGYRFATALMQGASLADAAAQAASENEQFDFARNLGGLLETGAIASFHEPTA